MRCNLPLGLVMQLLRRSSRCVAVWCSWFDCVAVRFTHATTSHVLWLMRYTQPLGLVMPLPCRRSKRVVV